MGRRKNLAREELLEKAMEVFRQHGFAGTSAEMLVEETGASRYSLYSDFGSKQGLFEAALDLYDSKNIDKRLSPLERPEAGLDEIRGLLEFYRAAAGGSASGKGCLLCNTAVEFGPVDPGGAGFVQRYFNRISAAFENALRNARAAGVLDAGADPAKEAAFLTSTLLGMFVMIRAKAPTKMIEEAVEVATAHINSVTDK